VDRKGWVDVALGTLTFTGLELVWLFALRRPWAYAGAAAARQLRSHLPVLFFLALACYCTAPRKSVQVLR